MEPAQTLLEIDYDTIIDDEDVVDEFGLFKNLLEGKKNVKQDDFVWTPYDLPKMISQEWTRAWWGWG